MSMHNTVTLRELMTSLNCSQDVLLELFIQTNNSAFLDEEKENPDDDLSVSVPDYVAKAIILYYQKSSLKINASAPQFNKPKVQQQANEDEFIPNNSPDPIGSAILNANFQEGQILGLLAYQARMSGYKDAMSEHSTSFLTSELTRSQKRVQSLQEIVLKLIEEGQITAEESNTEMGNALLSYTKFMGEAMKLNY